MSPLERRLRAEVDGEVLFDAASRGRYSTDASIYQVEPVGVLVPASHEDVRAAFDVCRELRIPMLPRGAGSSQCGQTVGRALVVDHSKRLSGIVAFDEEARTVTVEPGHVALVAVAIQIFDRLPERFDHGVVALQRGFAL